MSRPEWALSEIEQKVSRGDAVGHDKYDIDESVRARQQNSMGNVHNNVNVGEAGSFVDAMDRHFRRHGEERQALERRIDELQHIVADRGQRLDAAAKSWQKQREQIGDWQVISSRQGEEIQTLEARLQAIRRNYLSKRNAGVAAVVVAGLFLVLGLVIGSQFGGTREVVSAGSDNTRQAASPGETTEARNAVATVDSYFVAIRLHHWDVLPTYQSADFRQDNAPGDVSKWWAKNDVGLWAQPVVARHSSAGDWVRVPYIQGRLKSVKYAYAYWLVDDQGLIARGGGSGICPDADPSDCAFKPAPAGE